MTSRHKSLLIGGIFLSACAGCLAGLLVFALGG